MRSFACAHFNYRGFDIFRDDGACKTAPSNNSSKMLRWLLLPLPRHVALTLSHFGIDDNPKSKQLQQKAAMPPKVKSDKENKVNIKKGAEGRGKASMDAGKLQW